MSVLVIPQFHHSFYLNLRLYIIPGVINIIFKLNFLTIQYVLSGQRPGRN